MSDPAIELQGISKAFGPVQANKDISIRVMPGTIHGIIGENGAGKSTLMSILYGFYKADDGEIFIDGNKTEHPRQPGRDRGGHRHGVSAFQTGGKFHRSGKRHSGRRRRRIAAPSVWPRRARRWSNWPRNTS